jgi:hypothetical protein
LPRSLRKARVILRVARPGASEPTAEQNREVLFLGWQVEGHLEEQEDAPEQRGGPLRPGGGGAGELGPAQVQGQVLGSHLAAG